MPYLMLAADAPPPTETALIVPVPETGTLVDRHRERLDLAPEPDDPFRLLTAAVWAAFPDCPPYGGAHPDVVPHLTIGQCPTATTAALRAAERAVGDGLPLTARIDRVLLVAGSGAPRSWHTLAEYSLGVPADRGAPTAASRVTPEPRRR